MRLKIFVSALAVAAIFPLGAGTLYGVANRSGALPVASASVNAVTAAPDGIGWD